MTYSDADIPRTVAGLGDIQVFDHANRLLAKVTSTDLPRIARPAWAGAPFDAELALSPGGPGRVDRMQSSAAVRSSRSVAVIS
jgi:hypothetical protein